MTSNSVQQSPRLNWQRAWCPLLLAAVMVARTHAQAPSITTPPLSRTVLVGQPVSFTVAATGAAPLTYQWIRNGTPLAGATVATLELAGAALGDRGWYQVVVASGAAATRAVCVLDVTPPGTVPVAWGDNTMGQCTVPTGIGPVIAVGGGERHSVALRADRTVVAWAAIPMDKRPCRRDWLTSCRFPSVGAARWP